MNSNVQERGTIKLIGAGGCGINAVSFFNGANQEPNCANVETAYVDASRSNLKDSFAEEDVFVLSNVDGSGKVRKENHKEIANVIKQVIHQIEPGDLNVVVFSASGG